MNIKIVYLYRDGGNYKQYNEVIFSNPDEIGLSEIAIGVKQCLIEDLWFVADEWELPNQFFDEYLWNEEVDHNWHELHTITETDLPPTEMRTIKEFIALVLQKFQKNPLN